MLYSHYGILTTSPYCAKVIAWAQRHNLKIFSHLNRIRFFIPDAGVLHTEFMLRYYDHCHLIPKNQDLALGLAQDPISGV
jgi:hypothetical protein